MDLVADVLEYWGGAANKIFGEIYSDPDVAVLTSHFANPSAYVR